VVNLTVTLLGLKGKWVYPLLTFGLGMKAYSNSERLANEVNVCLGSSGTYRRPARLAQTITTSAEALVLFGHANAVEGVSGGLPIAFSSYSSRPDIALVNRYRSLRAGLLCVGERPEPVGNVGGQTEVGVLSVGLPAGIGIVPGRRNRYRG
jgi:hypothetical protein